MSKKKAHHEEHVDEAWLLPYADLLTLLLALFIVMFAMSKVDKEKFEKLSEQFSIIFAGGSGNMEKDGNSVIPLENSGQKNNNSGLSNSQIEEDKMEEIKRSIDKEINSEGYGDRVKVSISKEGLEISIQDVVLFDSGDAKVLKGVSPLLMQIAKTLSDLDNSIKVVGHTDNRPINNGKFRSNWDLSAMRAINVMNFLIDQGKLQPKRFSIQGYGQFLPKYDNSTEDGRSKNRRVEIFLIRKYPSESETGIQDSKAHKVKNTKTD